MAGRSSEPEAFTLLFRLLMTHFDRVDIGEAYTKSHAFGVCNGTPFCDFTREFRVLMSRQFWEANAPCLRGQMWCWRIGSDIGELAVSDFHPYISPWFEGNGPEAGRLVGCHVYASFFWPHRSVATHVLHPTSRAECQGNMVTTIVKQSTDRRGAERKEKKRKNREISEK